MVCNLFMCAGTEFHTIPDYLRSGWETLFTSSGYSPSSFNMKLYLKPTWVGDIDVLNKKNSVFLLVDFFHFKNTRYLKFSRAKHI